MSELRIELSRRLAHAMNRGFATLPERDMLIRAFRRAASFNQLTAKEKALVQDLESRTR